MNDFGAEKHYRTLNDYYRQKFNTKVYKIPLNGDFSVPIGMVPFLSKDVSSVRKKDLAISQEIEKILCKNSSKLSNP